MPNKTQEKSKGIFRHLLTLVGGILVTLGILSAEDSDIIVTAISEIVGAGLILWGTLASILNKDKVVQED